MFTIRPSGGPAVQGSYEKKGAGKKKPSGKKPSGKKPTKKKAARGKAPPPRRGLLRRLVHGLAILMVWAGLGVIGVVLWYAKDLPSLDSDAGLNRAPNITLLSRDGDQIASFGGLFGEEVELAALPPDLPRAVLAIEDRRFYDHFGVDPRGLARAMWRNLISGRIVEGGSTITQQLAKNLFLSPERSYRRKIQEVLLALKLEQRFDKDQILSIYLNRVYLGGGAYGVDAAARLYFGKSARAVTLYESALLAGLLKAPSRLNPLQNADAAGERTRLVLKAMEDSQFISAKQRIRALETKSDAKPSFAGRAPYFADWVVAQLRDYLGGVNGDIQVRTTLDPHLQAIAQKELAAMLADQGAARGASQAAMVSVDSSGAVRAMVGGRNYGESQFNRVTQALRQPGSAFKLFVYLAAFEKLGLGPDDRMLDAPVKIGDWEPGNYADKYLGEVTLREAFARSLNSVAVRLIQRLGPKAVAALAQQLGITSPLAVEGGLALGASEVTLLELTGAYGVIAAQGRGLWPHAILEITDARGERLYRRAGEAGPGRVASTRAVAGLRDMMTATVEWGTGKKAQIAGSAGGKTGTSQGSRDAWFVGYAGGLTTGVWFGNDDNSPMDRVTGGSLPAELWGRVMAGATPVAALPPPREALPVTPVEKTAAKEEPSFISKILQNLTGEAPSAADEETEERLQRYFRPDPDKR